MVNGIPLKKGSNDLKLIDAKKTLSKEFMVNGIALKRKAIDFKLFKDCSSPVGVELLENPLLHLGELEGVHIGHLGNLRSIHTWFVNKARDTRGLKYKTPCPK